LIGGWTLASHKTPTRLHDAKRPFLRTSLASLAFVPTLLTLSQTAWALAGNSTQPPVGMGSTNVNLETGAVVTFVILLLGLAAAFLLMGRFLNPRNRTMRRP
jgi:hypothetical protein